MPIYMDIHFIDDISVEDTRKAHLADLAVQEKYGVRYLQYWFNQKAKTVFCLMEAPDKESCAATHIEANGLGACQIVEVEGGLYDLFMGDNQQIDHGLVRHKDGHIDTGNRYILTLDIIAESSAKESIEYDQFKLPKAPKKRALEIINECNGREFRSVDADCIVAVFLEPEKTLECIYALQQEFNKYNTKSTIENNTLSYTIGVSVGQPLTENEGFFEQALKTSHRFCRIAASNETITSRQFEEICTSNEKIKDHISLRIIKPSDQDFLNALLDITDTRVVDFEFGVDILSKEIGFSKPQLYRKVTGLTGRSPVNFIRDLRMHKALMHIKLNKFNISQVALEVGYNSPSYFSKCFQDKFGIKPSQIVV